jgi:hypothetical protein
MATPHDPSYEVRRVLWRAYAVFAAGLILFFAALILIGHHRFGNLARVPAPPSASATPSGSPTALNPSASANPSGQSGLTPSGTLTATGYPPGEPPGDVEDDQPTPPAQAAGPAPNRPPGVSLPGVSLPGLPLPAVPALKVGPSLPPLR